MADLSKSPADEKQSSSPSPALAPAEESTANIFSKVILHWAHPIFSRASALHKENKGLEIDDLLRLPEQDFGGVISPVFEEAWSKHFEKQQQQLKRLGQGQGQPDGDEGSSPKKIKTKSSLTHALWAVIGRRFMLAGIVKLVNTALQFSFPLLLSAVLKFMEDTQSGEIPVDAPWFEKYMGYWLSALLFIAMATKALTETIYFHSVYRAGYQARVAISIAVYNKALRLSSSARHGKTLGELINLMQVDSTKIEMFVPNIHVLWDGMFQIVGYMTILYLLIGWPCFAGLGVMILAIPSQGIIMKKLFGINREMVKYTDSRVKTTNEAVQGIRCVKMYTWEDSFKDKIGEGRYEELKLLYKQAYLKGFSRSYMSSIPAVVAVVSLVIYAVAYEGATINASTLFAALVAFDQLRFPLLFYPMSLALYAQAKVSAQRVEEFLGLEEIKTGTSASASDGEKFEDTSSNVAGVAGPGTYKKEDKSLKTGELKVENITVYWSDPNKPIVVTEDDDMSVSSKGSRSSRGSRRSSKKSDLVKIDLDVEIQPTEEVRYPKHILSDVSMHMAPGELCAIIGRVGSGKTTLCSAILNETVIRGGDVGLNGSIAYAAQTPWILNATLRDNITFGKPFQKDRYDEVIRVCQLTHDLLLLDYGDMTEIGENGINLSGGQRQRVSIARAAYSDADIIILDDPLSALDPEVGQKLFDDCIVKFMKGKTRILSTNQLQFLQFCDCIVALSSRKIVEMGTFDEVSKIGTVQKMLEQFEIGRKSTSNSEGKAGRDRSDSKALVTEKDAVIKNDDGAKLVTQEERNLGAVEWSVYKKYILSGGGTCRFLAIWLAFFACTANAIFSSAWISVWTSDPTYERMSRSFYLGIYALLAITLGLFTFCRSFFLARFSVSASDELHKNALESVLNAPMSFFDTTPTGRILSRFSKDLYSIDLEICDSMDFFLFGSLSVMAAIGTILFVTPWFGIAIVPLAYVYFKVLNYFREVSRETKRLDSISRSPVFSHFSETLGGLGTIRSYGQADRFINDFGMKVDVNTRAYYNNKTADRWISVRLELLGSLIAGLSAGFATNVVLSESAAGIASSNHFASYAGLSISTSISIVSMLNWVVRTFANMEAGMNAAERILYYTEEIPQEAPSTCDKLEKHSNDSSNDKTFPAKVAVLAKGVEQPDTSWPQEGNITFNELKMRYRPENPLVLKGLSVEIKGGERVGVVGRTGSGKSSLLLTLLRIVEPDLGDSGNEYDTPITIDGVDVLRVGLTVLRQKVGIIPQDPVLFSGTIRSNMDPFDEHTDGDIWNALDRCGMKQTIEEMPELLQGPVSEYGENLSQGQRQLLCLGRSLLKKCRILLLDEATSSVDYETDSNIQRTLREDFKGCTVITIAHRVNTIMDSDKILVMQDGKVGEFASPEELLSDKNSIFSDIVKHAQSEQN